MSTTTGRICGQLLQIAIVGGDLRYRAIGEPLRDETRLWMTEHRVELMPTVERAIELERLRAWLPDDASPDELAEAAAERDAIQWEAVDPDTIPVCPKCGTQNAWQAIDQWGDAIPWRCRKCDPPKEWFHR